MTGPAPANGATGLRKTLRLSPRRLPTNLVDQQWHGGWADARLTGPPRLRPGAGVGPRRAQRAALTDERQRKVADALGDLARAELQDDKKRPTARSASGADLARKAARATR